mmetsp:Transcript_17510/g.29495  ORF Transcript_17510/g.29495 Transcript_17510/m.29495 type:complete len:225 (-) Transcript_17510:440-1114(-)
MVLDQRHPVRRHHLVLALLLLAVAPLLEDAPCVLCLALAFGSHGAVNFLIPGHRAVAQGRTVVLVGLIIAAKGYPRLGSSPGLLARGEVVSARDAHGAFGSGARALLDFWGGAGVTVIEEGLRAGLEGLLLGEALEGADAVDELLVVELGVGVEVEASYYGEEQVVVGDDAALDQEGLKVLLVHVLVVPVVHLLEEGVQRVVVAARDALLQGLQVFRQPQLLHH